MNHYFEELGQTNVPIKYKMSLPIPRMTFRHRIIRQTLSIARHYCWLADA
jgi:hypothetical protein